MAASWGGEREEGEEVGKNCLWQLNAITLENYGTESPFRARYEAHALQLVVIGAQCSFERAANAVIVSLTTTVRL